MILFKNVTMRYENGVNALNNVSFYVKKGEFVFMVGPSGAGKSTVAKLIFCEQKPTRGEIVINNINVEALRHRDMPYYRRTIGVVFQDFRLLPNKTAYDNVAFAMQIRNASSKEIRRAVPQALSLVGLSNKARVKPDELSGGEQQRVAIARAMVSQPTILIADEPTGNLDPGNAAEIMHLLDIINKRGTTVLTVTHSRDSVNKMKKRVIEIDNGFIVRDEKQGRY